MKKYFEVLEQCPLFAGIGAQDMEAMLGCLEAQVKTFAKNEYIFREGEAAGRIGVLLEGSARVEQTDYFGNRRIMAGLETGELFGESFACAGVQQLPVDVVAGEPAAVLFIDSGRITQTCCNACAFHQKMIYNLMQVLAVKNLMFHQRITVTAGRTTRDKLMAYLLLQAKRAGSPRFEIPFDRQGLADYLGVDRSGLSAEISKLRKEGRLTSEKNKFVLREE